MHVYDGLPRPCLNAIAYQKRKCLQTAINAMVPESYDVLFAGSCIIFTAALSVAILRRRLNWLHMTGHLKRLLMIQISGRTKKRVCVT